MYFRHRQVTDPRQFSQSGVHFLITAWCSAVDIAVVPAQHRIHTVSHQSHVYTEIFVFCLKLSGNFSMFVYFNITCIVSTETVRQWESVSIVTVQQWEGVSTVTVWQWEWPFYGNCTTAITRKWNSSRSCLTSPPAVCIGGFLWHTAACWQESPDWTIKSSWGHTVHTRMLT